MIPRSVDDITDAWISEALGTRCRILNKNRVGADRGFSGVCIRVQLEGPRPGSVLVKLPLASSGSTWEKRHGNAPFWYPRSVQEVKFYGSLSHLIRTPRCFWAKADQATQSCALILEDLTPARPGDALTLGTPQEVEAVLIALAAMHGATWNNPPPNLDSLWRDPPESLETRYQEKLPLFQKQYGAHVPQSLQPLLTDFASYVSRLGLALNATEECFVHGDVHLDNVFFDTSTGHAILIDWQGYGRGYGPLEAGTFLAASIRGSDLAAHETRLWSRYCDALAQNGVPEYTQEQGQLDYARALLRRLWVMVTWLGGVDLALYRGREKACVTQLVDDPTFFEILEAQGGPRLLDTAEI